MAKNRLKIPQKTQDEVIVKSRRKCYCGKEGDQIHHIDGNPSNNDFDNLVFLCYKHHNEFETKGGIRKRPTPNQLKKLRDKHYEQNDRKHNELKHYTATLKKITDENLYKASLEANIIIEIIKIKDEYYKTTDWKKGAEVIEKLALYEEYAGVRAIGDIFDFLTSLSYLTRNDMPVDISYLISSLTRGYFSSHSVKERKTKIELAEVCANIAFGIIYDSFIYLCNMAVATHGLDILKYLYIEGKRLNENKIINSVLQKYDDLAYTLNRPERKDLENAKALLKIYKDDLDNRGLFIPRAMPTEMFRLVDEHRKKSNQRTK